MRYDKDLVPYIEKDEFDDIAKDILQDHCPEVFSQARPLPIDKLVAGLGLQVKYVHLSDDLAYLGQICFTPGLVDIYRPETDEYVQEEFDEGDILIDPQVAVQRNKASSDFTIVHECVHNCLHAPHYQLKLALGRSKMAVAHRCPTEYEKRKRSWTKEDRMEWQADAIAGAILMPRPTFIQQAKMARENFKQIFGDNHCLLFEMLVEDMARVYRVSKAAASLRIKTLCPELAC